MTDAAERPEVTHPTVTGNAQLALGCFMGLLLLNGIYRPLDVDVAGGDLDFEHKQTGSRFRLNVVQIGGVE